GWSPRPGVVSREGMYQYESHGIRSRSAKSDYAARPPAGIRRIAIYGDSFAHCDDVPFEHSWGYHLETAFHEDGGHSEVLNFGVSAYGMDQALQRWRYLGKRFSPAIVLFGFQGENVARNVNLLRGFYVRNTGIPFSKPRFLLDAHGRLQAINDPTLPVDTVPSVMANMTDWDLARHEWFYNPAESAPRWWHRSRFVSLLVERFRNHSEPDNGDPYGVFEPGGEPERVTLQILREFREDVEKRRGRFYVVRLPKKSDLQRLARGRPLASARLWAKIAAEHRTIDPLPALQAAVARDGLDSQFAAPKHAHYSDAANRIIARKIADALRTPGR
ncbi:MAG: hypothetical protein ACE5KM_16585, partial [Planctomycetaceae bacterium]